MNHFDMKGGALHAEDVAIADIAAAVGTPFLAWCWLLRSGWASRGGGGMKRPTTMMTVLTSETRSVVIEREQLWF